MCVNQPDAPLLLLPSLSRSLSLCLCLCLFSSFLSCRLDSVLLFPLWGLLFKMSKKNMHLSTQKGPTKGASRYEVFKILTPSPLSAFGTDLHYKIHTTSFTMSALPWPPPPMMRTSYLVAPFYTRILKD